MVVFTEVSVPEAIDCRCDAAYALVTLLAAAGCTENFDNTSVEAVAVE